MISCLQLPHPQRETGSLGGWSNGKAAARRDNLPPALLPGAPGNTPSRLATRAVSGPAPGTCRSFLDPAWPGRVPATRLIVPPLPLFLCRIVPVISILHTAAAAQESVAAAEAAAEAAAGAQVSRRPGLPAQSCPPGARPRVPANCLGGGVHGMWPCSICDTLVLGVWGGGPETLGPRPSTIQVSYQRHAQSVHQGPCAKPIPESHFPSPLTAGLSVLLTRPNKAEEMRA